MAAIIGALRVSLGLDTGSYEDGLKKASSNFKAFGTNITTIAGGIQLSKILDKAIEALGDMAMATFKQIDAMDKMGKEAQKLGIPVEELSKLSVAAKLSDVEIGELSKSIVQLSKRLVEGADSATDPARRAMQALGISAKTATGEFKSGNQITAEVADRFSRLRDGMEKTTAATMLFGRAGANMIPLLNEGSEGLKKSAEMASKLGLVMGTEASQAAQKFNDNMKLVGLALTQGVFNVIAEKLLPIFVVLSESLLDLTIKFMGLIGAGDKIAKAMDDLRDRLKLPTDEEARKAEQLREKLFSLQVQTRSLRGDFINLAPGLMEAGTALKLVKGNAETLPTTFAQLSPAMQRLNQELFNFKAQQITQETLAPWDAYIQKMMQLDMVFKNSTLSVEAFRLKAAEAADNLRSTYITATAGIAASFSEMFTAIGGENKEWAKAAKVAAAANALISTFAGAAKALEQGGVFGIAFAAAVIAKGLTLVAAIKGTALGMAAGGSFTVPGGVSGVDNKLVPMNLASGERVTVEPAGRRGGAGVREVTLPAIRPRDFFTGETLRAMVDALNDGDEDGYRLRFAR